MVYIPAPNWYCSKLGACALLLCIVAANNINGRKIRGRRKSAEQETTITGIAMFILIPIYIVGYSYIVYVAM